MPVQSNTASDRRRALANGYTLFELIVVVTIIAAIAAIAIAPFARSLTIQRVDAAARRVAADLELAREQARRASADQSVTFTLPDVYTLSGMGSMERSADAYQVNVGAEPYVVAITWAKFGGDGTVVFDGYGVPDSAGHVVVQSGSQTRTITLDAEGRSSIADSTGIPFDPELGPGPFIVE